MTRRMDEPTISDDAIKRSIDSYCAGISAMNVDTILTAFAEDAVDTDPVGSPPLKGHAQIRSFFETIFGTVASVRFNADNVHGLG
ncbi:MAG: nuclear transport factor 2 family protein, partial [Ktedonobacterales bacterium]